MASASLGQVHRAVLRDGRAVAVKVQRPGIGAQVRDDMEVIEELAAFVDEHTRTGDRLRFAAMAAEFRRSILTELDYRKEAENLRRLAADLRDHQRIVVPLPIDDYTTSAVLTMQLIQGRNLGSIGPLGRMELDGAELARALFRCYLDQILVHGFVHADPHPGNVLLTDDGDLALIDLGMVVRVAPGLQDQLVRLLASLSEGQASEVAALLVEMGEQGPSFDREGYDRDIKLLLERNQALTVGQLETGRVVGELVRAAATNGLRPPVEMTMVGKALLNLDQVARILDPDFDPNAALRDQTAEILRSKLLASASPASVLHAAMDAKEFAERFPGRINKVMDALAEGQLTLNIAGIDEVELMRGVQKLANRVTPGLVVAAHIVGGAMVMRVEGGPELFGYSAVAVVLFAVAAVIGIWLLVTSVLNDLPQRRRRP
jgi:predicted unusual protein kinase regulating ubiquinone biosynthesis (AarF/ABC1/UbiB family)